MTKSEYRDTILRMKKYIKVTNFCSICSIGQSALSYFLKGRDELISIENLELLVNTIRNEISDL